jgi:hypothetical protein
MPTLTPSQAVILGFIVAPILFVASAYFTRATPRRILGGLAGGVAYAVSTFGWDRVAAGIGWWYYPFDPTVSGQVLALYAPAGLVSGGAFGLIGWRVTRRFGKRGLAAFLVAWGVWGTLHDVGGSALFASSHLMIFQPGPIPVAAAFLNYATCGALAQLAVWLVAGPTRADRLARTGCGRGIQ